MTLRKDHPVAVAAAKAGMSPAAGYRLLKDPQLPKHAGQGPADPPTSPRPSSIEAVRDNQDAE